MAGETSTSVRFWSCWTGPFQTRAMRFQVHAGRPGPVWVRASGSMRSTPSATGSGAGAVGPAAFIAGAAGGLSGMLSSRFSASAEATSPAACARATSGVARPGAP